jgi:hypothetical protein
MHSKIEELLDVYWAPELNRLLKDSHLASLVCCPAHNCHAQGSLQPLSLGELFGAFQDRRNTFPLGQLGQKLQESIMVCLYTASLYHVLHIFRVYII